MAILDQTKIKQEGCKEKYRSREKEGENLKIKAGVKRKKKEKRNGVGLIDIMPNNFCKNEITLYD